MKNKLILGSISLLIVTYFSCITNEKFDHSKNCLEKIEWVNLGDSILIKMDNERVLEKCIDDVLKETRDTATCRILIQSCRKLILLDANSNRIYEAQIPRSFLVDRTGDSRFFHQNVMYTSVNEFYLFDECLNPIYNSKQFIQSLNDSLLLGASGIQISYDLQDVKRIILKYDILTDLDPVLISTVTDTIFIDSTP